MENETAQWTIEELVERANRALQQGGLATHDRRVREQLSLRQARLYTSLGLLDRPVLRGRTGFYGLRHLLQLVAIKRLQMLGYPLVDIQNRLLAIGDEDLRQIAQVPPEVLSGPARVAGESVGRRRRELAFWSQRLPLGVAKAPCPEPEVEHWLAIPIGEDAKLLLSSRTELDAETLQALRQAAEPLRQLIEGLQSPRSGKSIEGGNNDD